MNVQGRQTRRPPSDRARNELVRILSTGVGRNENIVSEFVRNVARALIQQLLEAEQGVILGSRGRYSRHTSRQRGSRNGYESMRLHTEEGVIKVDVPQVRNLGEPYRSHLMHHLSTDPELLNRTVLHAYVPWLSDRREPRKVDLPIPPSVVSEVIAQFAADHQNFLARDLSDISVEQLFCDQAFESSKRRGSEEVLLIAWAIDAAGRKHVLHLAVDDKASTNAWNSLFRDLTKRHLVTPKSVTANGANGVIDAIATVFPRSVRVRHWFDRPTERKSGIG